MSNHTRLAFAFTGVFAAALLGACSIDFLNSRASQELALKAQPAGSVYTGWRVFQDKCASCHGPAGLGTAAAPNLLPKVRDIGPRQFVDIVLRRYDWNIPADRIASQGAGREALLEQLVQRQDYMLTMPVWQGEPRVTAHIVDLYAYLLARAEGSQGTDRPQP
jgi:hypothetical protein